MNTTQRELIFFTFSGSSVDERGKTHHGKSNLFQETPKPLCSTFLPTDVKHCLNVGYTFVNFTTSEAVWKSHVCITRKSWPLFKSKKIAQVVRAWIQSKNSLVKHFEDMRLCRPSKEYLPKLVPLGKVCTAKETLEKNTAKGTKCKLEPLISLTDDLSLLSNMAALESCPKHNMIAYLEKTEGNVEFHEVIDFLRRSYISHALTVSPVVSTTFVEQFWTSAKSKTINNVRHITAKVAGKVVSISEASIRTDLIFDDADGIDTLPNQAIFNAIQLMGYEGDLNRQLANISVPLDHFPVNSLTSKVFSFMIKRGKHFSGKVTPLFDTMLVQPTQAEGASSERLSDAQPSPSPAPTSEVPNESLPDSTSAQPSEVPFEQQPDPSPSPSPQPSPTPTIPDSIPEPSGENHEDHSSNDASLSGNEDDMTLQNVYYDTSYRRLSHCKKTSQGDAPQRNKDAQKECIPNKGERNCKRRKQPVQRDPMFDVMPEDNIDQMETEDAQSEGRTKEMVDEDKEIDEDRVSTEDGVSTAKDGVSDDDHVETSFLAEKLQEQEREQFTIEERAKFLHDTIAAQRKFLA
ncbi:xylulose kinase-1 [Tanacetum coccineum]